MAKSHLKTIAAPKTWLINRKSKHWIIRPNISSQKMELGMPIHIILKDIMHYGKTKKEIQKILNDGLVLINGKKAKDRKTVAGLFDVVTIVPKDENFRVVFDKKRRLVLIKISKEESSIRPSKVISKKMVKGKLNVYTSDGRTFQENKDLGVNDTAIVELPKQQIKKIIKFEEGALVHIIGAKNTARTGTIKKIENDYVYIELDKQIFKTLKKSVFVIGKEKPEVKLE